MSQDVQRLDVLIASASDVQAEREVIKQCIGDWNAAHSDSMGISLRARCWEVDGVPETGQRGQEVLNRQIVDPSDILLGVFWWKMGTPTGIAESGTVEEIERFVKAGKQASLYFSRAPIPYDHDAEQLAALRRYKVSISQTAFYAEFSDVNELFRKVTLHLPSLVTEWIEAHGRQLSPGHTGRLFLDSRAGQGTPAETPAPKSGLATGFGLARAPSIGAQPHANGTRFRVWAPDRTTVEVVLFDDHGQPREVHSLEPSNNGYFGDHFTGMFCGEIEGVGAGDRYKYRLDGGDSFPDPASRYQPEGVHGPSEVVDPGVFTWTDAGWHGVKLEELVLYEVHVGTATREGTFDALITHLGAIRDLGATAILVMAIADVPGSHDWGYDGVNLFAPSRAYGGPEAFRRLVNAAHCCYGLGVILDVVFNHVGSIGAYLDKFTTSYFSEEHMTPWGPGFEFDGKTGSIVGDFFIANGCHWALEYHVDGLRLDAIHAIQDRAEPHIVSRIADQVRAVANGRSFLVIAEDDTNYPKLVRPTEARGFGLDAVYADDFHHQIHVALTGEKNWYYADYSGTVEDLTKTMRQSWWFTGQYSQVRKDSKKQPERIGAPADDIPRRRFVWSLQNHDQVGNRPFGERLTQLKGVSLSAYRVASALLLLSPHTPLLFMGQEWAASTPFLFFADYGNDPLAKNFPDGRMNDLEEWFPGYDRTRTLRPDDPLAFSDSKLRWRERTEDPHAGILELYKDLLRLRKAIRFGERNSFKAEPLDSKGASTLALHWTGAAAEDELLAIANLKGSFTLDMKKVSGQLRTGASRWTTLLDTEDRRYGGRRDAPALNGTTLSMGGAGFILLGARKD